MVVATYWLQLGLRHALYGLLGYDGAGGRVRGHGGAQGGHLALRLQVRVGGHGDVVGHLGGDHRCGRHHGGLRADHHLLGLLLLGLLLLLLLLQKGFRE